MSDHAARNALPLALLFTDGNGQVVFVDENFLRLLHCVEAGIVVGEPLHKALGIERQVSNGLMRQIADAGYVHEWPLALCRTHDAPVDAVCTGVATYDDQGGFIGADLTLRAADSESPTQDLPTDHRAALHTHIQQIQVQAKTQEEHAVLQLYVAVQISALQILLIRMGGRRVRDALDGSLAKLTARQDWPVRLQDGQVIFGHQEIEPDVYYALLAEAVHFCINIMGRRMVVNEMQVVDGVINDRARAAAHDAGLTALFDA